MKIALACIAVLAALAFLALRSTNVAMARVAAARSTAPVTIGPGPLGIDDFWRLVDHSAVFEADPDAQLSDLRASLDRLSAEQIIDFERHFDATRRASYRWDLWGAAYLANGGASDDGFEYFRCWLISKGRATFEAVAADPDRLAEQTAPGADGYEFEAFAYVAREAWAAKTGRDAGDMPDAANMIYPGMEPAGTPFSEDPAALAKRYPKLWARFGG